MRYRGDIRIKLSLVRKNSYETFLRVGSRTDFRKNFTRADGCGSRKDRQSLALW